MNIPTYVQISLPIGYGKLPTQEQKETAVKRADELQLKLEEMGYTVLNPFDFPHRDDYSYQQYLEVCKQMMRSFRPIMFFAEGFSESSGCGEELTLANNLNLHIIMEQYSGLKNMQDFIEHRKARLEYYQDQIELNT